MEFVLDLEQWRFEANYDVGANYDVTRRIIGELWLPWSADHAVDLSHSVVHVVPKSVP